jgi:RNA-directed DNA polymerase
VRFAQCALTMHPDKTKIIYCKDGSRKGVYPNTQFDFLGYTFRARTVKNSKKNSLFVSFTPAVSSKAVTAMRQKTRKLNYRNRTDLSLAELARMHNPILRGWLEYYGKFCRSAMYPVLRHFNTTLVAWAMKKFKRLKGRRIRASHLIEGIAERQPWLFVHWQRGMTGGFA